LNISIIIFGYNEQGNILKVFQNVREFLELHSRDYEIIIIDDGSNDNTPVICDEIIKTHHSVKIINHSRNMGIGMALRSGYEIATKEYVCAIPADGQFNVFELDVVKPFKKNLYYSFYRPQTNYSIYRKCLTWGNRLFNQHILSVFLRDVNWIKVYRREQLDMVKPELKSSLIESEICAKLYRHGVLPIEIPSAYLERKFGVSRGGSWNTLRKAIVDLFFLFWVVVTYQPSEKLD
jgi:glycosyltransferase involved in cell wall biosynthesis